MSNDYAITRQNKVRQISKKAAYDVATVHAILDAGLCAHAAFVQDGEPVVVPMLYGRDGETLYLHGARKARIIKLLEGTGRTCINVTLLDGLVFARSTFNSSMHYRSVTVHGSARLIDDHQEKLRALEIIAEATMPGRWSEVRESLDNEVKMTGIIEVAIESAAAKVSAAMPDDEDFDMDAPVWAGVLPIETRFAELLDDDQLAAGLEPSANLQAMQGRKL